MTEPDAALREVEAKFELDAAAREALLRLDEVAGFRVVARRRKPQDDMYFDTAGADLARAGATLRVRRAEGGALMTFKGDRLPALDDAEAHVASRIEDEVPLAADLAELVTPNRALPEGVDISPMRRARRIVPHGALEPVARIQNERVVVDLVDADGARVEMAIDRARGTRLRDGRVVEFDEVELETKGAGRAALTRLMRALQERVPGMRPSAQTKLGRTLE